MQHRSHLGPPKLASNLNGGDIFLMLFFAALFVAVTIVFNLAGK